MKTRICITLENPVVEKLDTLRRLAKRSTYIENLIKQVAKTDTNIETD
ncbi:Uncharacterised protein [uncultured archaeon]|nr:Uncharacterised protein [uncultured archaeon]